MGILIYPQKQGAGCDEESSSPTYKTREPVCLLLCTHTKMMTTLPDQESLSFFLNRGSPQRKTRGGSHGERR